MAGKDDEQEIPFRWSLFLPAPGDAPSMRMLKYAVIGMGIILILGFMVIAARIVYLTTRIDASPPPGSAVTAELPAGAEVSAMSLDGNRLALHLKGPAENERSVVIVDMASGRIISRVRLAPTPSAPLP